MHLAIMSVGDHHGVRFRSAVVEDTIGNRKQGDSRNNFAGGKEAWNSENVSERHTDEVGNRRVMRTEDVGCRVIVLTRLKEESYLLNRIGR